jgi:hypothetical protein
VIGDLDAVSGDVVTFWGAQWAKDNSFSLGSAPNAFKGFTSTVPTKCGGTWSSGPGNSPSSPATIPEFITVIASSKVTQSGSTIFGDVKKIVIVKTNPGYGPDPGHAGIGTVLSVVCSN